LALGCQANKLVASTLRLVVKIAHEYRRTAFNLLDLVQEGNMGLMQAVQKYDPYRGVKLSSYAAWWIRAYMLKFILNNWRLVKLGTTQAQRKLFFNLNKEKAPAEGYQAPGAFEDTRVVARAGINTKLWQNLAFAFSRLFGDANGSGKVDSFGVGDDVGRGRERDPSTARGRVPAREPEPEPSSSSS